MAELASQNLTAAPEESACAYRVLRYTPNLVRDEWVNIGILLFNPQTGERRLRMIEDEEEYRRVRRLHPQADEPLLRALRDDLEDRFQSAGSAGSENINGWQQLLAKWDDTLSNALQLAPQKGIFTSDLNTELERLYSDHVAVPYQPGRVGAPGSRARVRSYCSQVFRQAHLWERIEKSVRAEQWTLPGDPLRIDYSYRRNGTRGFVHTLSVTRAPGDFKQLAYTAERIHSKEKLKTEFAAVTDVPLLPGNKRDDFVAAALREVGIEPVAMESFAVWVAKLKPLLQ
jgi:Protein of unknown function (DUF3037)